jgi:RNA recognition motif-containing protein
LTFSSTPTTPHSAQFPGGFAGGSGSLQYDYTSLFVGGLPPSWEEENVQNVFGRFSGLEEVQLIRPSVLPSLQYSAEPSALTCFHSHEEGFILCICQV